MAKFPVITDHFAPLASAYDVLLCDIWGVVHNGVAAFTNACDALKRFRERGGTVVLISNAPRPGEAVIKQLDSLSVPREAYDAVTTSGDVTREYVASRPGATVYHLGPKRDLPIFAGLDVEFGSVSDAHYVVCSGLFNDDTETPEDYRAQLLAMRARGLFMVCANPDVVVERGDKLIYCAGAIADLYAQLGGDVLYAGKPHRPVYMQALAKAAHRCGTEVPLTRVLAIGDSLRTDVRGAAQLGVDCLFVTGGIHAEELGGRDEPDPATLDRILSEEGLAPKAITRRLAW